MAVLDQKLQDEIDNAGNIALEKFEKDNNLSDYEKRSEEIWNLYPDPKNKWNEAYNTAKYLVMNYTIIKEFDLVKKWLNRMIDVNNNLHQEDDEILFYIGQYYFETGNYQEALANFKLLVEERGFRCFEGEDPKYKLFYKNPEKYMNGNVPDEEEHIKNDSLTEEDLDKIEKLTEKGDKYFEADKLDEAMNCYEQALAILPDDKTDWEDATILYTSMGDVYFNQENYTDALHCYNKALQSPDGIVNPYIWFSIGQVHFINDDLTEAKEALLRAYMLDGEEIFEDEDPEYFDLIKDLI